MRGIVLIDKTDLLAKNQFMNFIQFNGDYDCLTCCIKDENVPLLPKGSIHVYPYENNVILRTLTDCINWTNEATPDNLIIGVKGLTVLSILMFNSILILLKE